MSVVELRLALMLCAWATACAPPPSARPVTGPDGSRMLFVRCGSDTGRCYELAGQNCPGGYDLFPSIGREAGDVLVRCRVARPYGTSAWGWAPAPDPVDPWAPRGAAPAPPSTAPPPPLSGPGGAVPSSSADPRFRRFDDPDLGY